MGAQWYIQAGAFKELEKRSAVVYWDQRACGTSQGTPPSWSFATGELVKDMDAVVALVRARFAPRRLFVFGHSWGGFLGTAWLVDPEHQRGVDGFMMVAGAYDLPHRLDAQRQTILEYAEAKLALGLDTDTWQEARDWASAMPVKLAADWSDEELASLNKYLMWVFDLRYEPPIDYSQLLSSPMDAPAFLRNAGSMTSNYGTLADRADLTADMAGIRVPTLITWGRNDLNVPVLAAQKAFDALGTTPADKQLVLFDDSGHYPFWNEERRWLDATTSFIDQH
jgi:proline iminopeptidase